MTLPTVLPPPQARPWLRPAVAVALTAAVLVAASGLADPAVRTVAVVLFLALAPGLALVGLLRIPDAWRELAMVIGASLALDLVVASAFAYAGERSSGPVLAVLVGLVLLGSGAQCARPAARAAARRYAS
jgi:uncharacterized membrane protein